MFVQLAQCVVFDLLFRQCIRKFGTLQLFKDAIPLNIMVAFTEPSRGFGYNGAIPWPYIRQVSVLY